MNLTINIDESMFDEVIQKEIAGIPKEDLQQLIKDCIVARVNQPKMDKDGKYTGSDILESFLFEKSNSYGYYNSWKAGKILEEALKQIDYSEVAEEIKKTVIEYVKSHHKEVTMELLWQFMTHGIGNMTWNSSDFQNNLRQAICSVNTDQ